MVWGTGAQYFFIVIVFILTFICNKSWRINGMIKELLLRKVQPHKIYANRMISKIRLTLACCMIGPFVFLQTFISAFLHIILLSFIISFQFRKSHSQYTHSLLLFSSILFDFILRHYACWRLRKYHKRTKCPIYIYWFRIQEEEEERALKKRKHESIVYNCQVQAWYSRRVWRWRQIFFFKKKEKSCKGKIPIKGGHYTLQERSC